MPFGLVNASAAFIDLMNRVFSDYLDKFDIVFIKDTLVFSKSHEELEQHLKLFLQQLRSRKLHAKFSKYSFWLEEVAFLCHIMKKEGMMVDPEKVKAVAEGKDLQICLRSAVFLA